MPSSQSQVVESPKPEDSVTAIAERPVVQSKVLPWLSKLAYFCMSKLVFPWYFRKITITGQEQLPQDGPIILAPMHRSRWDAVIVPYATGRNVTGRDVHFMVSKNEIKGFQGWFIRRLGGFPVDCDQPGRLRALASSVRHGVELLAQRKMMVVFPEGNIYRDGELHPLKTGIAHMVLQAAQEQNCEVKVVPMGLAYDQPYPKRGSSVAVAIAPAISTAHYAHLNNKQAVRALTADLTQALLTVDPRDQFASPV